MQLIIHNKTPFSACEDPLFTVKFGKIDTETLTTYLQLVTEKVTEKIIEILPEQFSIEYDGWDNGYGDYFIGFYKINNIII